MRTIVISAMLVGCGGYDGEIGEWEPKPLGKWDIDRCSDEVVALLDAPVRWDGAFVEDSTVTLHVAGQAVDGTLTGSQGIWYVDFGGPVEMRDEATGIDWVLGAFEGPVFYPRPNGLKLDFADAETPNQHCFANYR